MKQKLISFIFISFSFFPIAHAQNPWSSSTLTEGCTVAQNNGQTAYNQGKYEEAKRHFSLALQYCGDDSSIKEWISRCDNAVKEQIDAKAAEEKNKSEAKAAEEKRKTEAKTAEEKRKAEAEAKRLAEEKEKAEIKTRFEIYDENVLKELGISYFVVKQKSNLLWGIVDKKGNIVVKCTYEQPSTITLKNGYVALMKNKVWDVFNTSASKIATGIEKLDSYK